MGDPIVAVELLLESMGRGMLVFVRHIQPDSDLGVA